MTKFIKSAVMFAVGFCLYITIEVCFRGYSYPLMGICGGIIFILIDLINNKISWNLDFIVQGGIGSTIITATELIVGETLKILNIPAMWDYSDIPFNFDGVICLPFSVIWIGISMLGIMVADAINYYVFDEKPTPYYKILGKTAIEFKAKECKG